MPIINLEYKRITFLTTIYTLTIIKRFAGNMPDKFGSLIRNTCKKGAGCAMQANVANAAAASSAQKKALETPTIKSKNNATSAMSNLTEGFTQLNQQKTNASKKHILFFIEAEKKNNNPFLRELNTRLPEKPSVTQSITSRNNLFQMCVNKADGIPEYSVDLDYSNIIETGVMPPISVQTMPKMLQESLVEPYVIHKNTNLAQEIQDTLDFLVKCDLLTDDYTKLTSKFYSLPPNPNHPYQTLDLNSLKNTPITFQVGLLNISENTIILSGLQNHVNVIAKITPTNKIIIGYLTSQKNQSNIKLSEEQPFPTQNISNKKPQMFHPLNTPMLIHNNLIIDLITYNKDDSSIINQQELGNAFINNNIVNDLLQTFYEKKVIPEIISQKGSLQIYNGDGLTRETIEYALVQEEQKRNSFIKKAIIKYEHLKKELNVNKLEKWLYDTRNNTDKETFEKLELAIKEYNAKHK